MKIRKHLVVAWFFIGFAIAIMGLPLSLYKGMSDDFLVYISELHCVVRGIDPYDVWTGTVKSDTFYPYERAELKTETRRMPIHGHTPWFYTYFLPFSGDGSLYARWIVWELCQIPFFLIIVGVAYSLGKRFVGSSDADAKPRALFVAAAALSVGFAFPLRFIGNNLLMAAAALALMVYCLVVGRGIAAGICWAIVVTKPQDGFLLVIPLLFARQWKTILTAGLVCLSASALSSYLIGKPIVDLILEVPKLKTVHESAALIPNVLADGLIQAGVGESLIQSSSMAIGVALCVALSWLVRKSEDWLVRVLPAIMCASIWTYMDSCDRCIFFVVQTLFACRFLTTKSPKERFGMVFMMIVVFCTCIQPILYCGGLISALGSNLGIGNLAQICAAIVNPIDTVAMVLFVGGVIVFCIMEYQALRRVVSARIVLQSGT